MTKKELQVGTDVGHSSIKIIIVDGLTTKAKKQSSKIAYLPGQPTFEDEPIETLVGNLHKNMVVNITSNSISRMGLYAVGEGAAVHDAKEFKIKRSAKLQSDITIIQPLSMIAATVIQNEFNETGEIPGTFDVSVEYSSAIPVVDYTKEVAKKLEERLIGSHVLIVYVGEGITTTVTINITKAKIVQEGVPAFYALLNADQQMFKSYNEKYGTSFDGKSFLNRKILFVDIGDGTLELIYILNGKPVSTKSRGYRYGVGYASEKALKAFKVVNDFDKELSRTNFMDKIINTNDKWHVEAKRELDLVTFEQQENIYNAIVETIEDVLFHDLDDVVVFGGGTNIFTDLREQIEAYTDKYRLNTLWIDGKIASLLNAYGLNELNKNVFYK